MYFDNYKSYADAQINPKLLWEYDLTNFDFFDMKTVIVQRVIEIGLPNDWYLMLNLYGVDGIKDAIKEVAYLNDKDMHFVSFQFEIPLKEMKCYTKKQSVVQHWNS